MALQSVTVLGSTGSVGRSTLDVLGEHRNRYQIHALTAATDVDGLYTQCLEWHPEVVVMADAAAARTLSERLNAQNYRGEVRSGTEALAQVASESAVDVVVAAIVGSAGLLSALAAAQSGKRLLLANKEALVMSGQLLTRAANASGARIIPLDSEHNAIFQCLPSAFTEQPQDPGRYGIKKIWLTASGGPFRGLTKEQLSVVSRQQALKHPNWEMGPKITIDSATMMNKGLEVIEASHLFALRGDQIDVVVHPQSLVHSMVGYVDGSVVAQLGMPDMRTPIAHALAWPDRLETSVAELDLCAMADLSFEAPDFETFHSLRLSFAALAEGGTAPTVLNAANEVAVALYLQDRVSFLQLTEIVEETLNRANIGTADDLETILNADTIARQSAQRIFEGLN
ncbi:MAG: 1-deoxy-D-xylulose-5-phosphate reductoisomerase [Gammaproteobacteria bacterium]|nr:1-deoxy-D-xylulose-5-phosphate reductoisomerase [Gammaproteobacteria bacterium]